MLSASVVTHRQVDSVLTALDAAIARIPANQQQKEARISELRSRLSTARYPETKMNIMRDLYYEYRVYQNDSATYYADRFLDLAVKQDRPLLIAEARMALLDSYLTVGLFKEAAEIDAQIEPALLPVDLRVSYYLLKARMYQNMESYVSRDSKLGIEYAAHRTAAYDSIIAITQPGSYSADVARLERQLVYEAKPQLAVDTRRRFVTCTDLTEHDRAVNYSILGSALLSLNDKPGAIYYYALSAIQDINTDTRETTAAKDLAKLMLETGDIRRANNYIHMALDDATFFNSRLRAIEIGQVMPKIEIARYNWLSSQRWALLVIVLVVGLSLAMAVMLAYKLKNRNAQLATSHAEINRKNLELEDNNNALKLLNTKLHETTEIKDQYIMQSLYGNTDFVEEVETKCTKALARLKAGKYAELGRIINSINVKQQRQLMYTAFDEAFLKLFPNFFDEFNKLLEDDYRIGIDGDGRLPTDVRIFALLRLGIRNPVEVAKYFNISVNTVYVYKTRIKSHAKVSKTDFDNLVLAIPKP